MQRFIEDFWAFIFDGGIVGVWEVISASTPFLVLKILIAIYVTILLVDIILLIYLGDVKSQLRALRTGGYYKPTNEKETKRKWKKITKRLDDDDENQWKVAVLEADDVVNNYLAEEA